MTGFDQRALRVAIVGSGPAGMYAAGHLLESPAGTYLRGNLVDMVDRHVEVDVFDRLPTPWGLVRAGVAPDHPEKKRVSKVFEAVAARQGFRFFGNVEVGRDVTPTELAEWYDAVIYAVGAAGSRELAVPGDDLSGCFSAREFVAWYNGHPDYSQLQFDLSSARAVIVGNGNVALDVARILTLDVGTLQQTDISDVALKMLQDSAIREVVILGRRGPAHAAFNTPELEELGHLDSADVIIDGDLQSQYQDTVVGTGDPTMVRKLQTLRQLAERQQRDGRKRIVFRFFTSPIRLLGAEQVEGIVVARNELERHADGHLEIHTTGEESVIDAGLVLSAIGYQGSPIVGLPFDDRRCVVPHRAGRVVAADGVVPGAYVTGWIKRGPTGIIGTNKKCARETVHSLLTDVSMGRLATSTTLSADAIAEVVRKRKPDAVPYAGWKAIDRDERRAGQRDGRPRVKFITTHQLLSAAAAARDLS